MRRLTAVAIGLIVLGESATAPAFVSAAAFIASSSSRRSSSASSSVNQA